MIQTENTPHKSKIFDWLKQFSVAGIGQILVTAISFFSGILVIRLLNQNEYALYTLANTILGTMVILADGGISNGVMALSARYSEDPVKLGTIMNTGFRLRKQFAIISLLIATPILIYLLRTNHVSWLMSFMLFLSLIPAFYSSLSGNLLEIIAKVHQDILPLQKIRIEANIGRLVLICIVIFIFPWAFLAVLASGIPQILANYRLRKNAAKYADLDQPVDENISRDIKKVVSRILPGAFYYSIQGQITVWLISIFGKGTSQIAEVGGLDRISMIVTLFTAMFVTVVTPRFAKIHDNKGLLFRRAVQIQLMLLVVGVSIVAGAWLFDVQILWLLGPDYSDLGKELILNVCGASLAMMGGNLYSLFTNRGWNIHPGFSIPMNIITLISGILLFDISTVSGVLYLNILINTVSYIAHTIYLYLKIGKS